MRCATVVCAVLSALGVAQAAKDTIAVLHAPRSVEYESNVRQHSAAEVADFLAQSLGLPSYRRTPSKLANVQPLSLPKASVLFVVDEAPVESKDFSDAVVFRDVVPTGTDDLSTLVTMLTGQREVAHGIIGRSWLGDDGEEQAAFSGSSHMALAGNMADYISQLFGGALTLAVSSDPQLARAAAPRAAGNAVVYAWDKEAQSFASLAGQTSSQLALSRDAILAEVPVFVQTQLAQATYDAATRTLTVGAAALDLNTEADFLLVAELVAVQHAIAAARATAGTTTTSHPDFLAFVLAGPKGINKAHGADSAQAQLARQLVTAFITNASNQAVQAYHGQAVVSVVSLGVRTDFVLPLRRRRDVVAPAANNGTATADKDWYTATFPVTFHIVLWLVVGLIVAVWMAVYACMTMDPGYDSVIYRTTGGARQKAE